MLVPCKFVRTATLTEDFASVAQLADHIHDLRGERPIVLKRAMVTEPDRAGVWMVAVRFAEERPNEGAIGYALIGAPPKAAGVQYDLLGGALAAAMPLEHDEAA